MSSNVGLTLGDKAKAQIGKSSNKKTTWKDTSKDEEKCFVGLLQIYNDKLKTSLKSASLTFYMHHVALLNFKETCKRKQIMSGNHATSYFPTVLENAFDDRLTYENPLIPKLSKAETMYTLHESVKFVRSALKSFVSHWFLGPYCRNRALDLSSCSGFLCGRYTWSQTHNLCETKSQDCLYMPKMVSSKGGPFQVFKSPKIELARIYRWNQGQTVMNTWFRQKRMLKKFPFITDLRCFSLSICKNRRV